MPARVHILSASSKPGAPRQARDAALSPSKDGETGTAQVPCHPPVGSMSFAHDLRNILSSVRGYTQLLLSMADDDRQVRTAPSGQRRGPERAAGGADLAGKMVEYLTIIEAESGKCSDLIDRMLGSTELAGGSALESDVARAAGTVCDLARGEAAVKGVDLAWETERELSPTAIPQEDLERVLLNLVRNGIQATPQGGRVEVRVGGCRLNGGAPGLEVEISDTGRGIPEYALEMIFQPFFSTHGSGEGLGLGLSISSALVERCGGSIEAKSKEGIGTTFTVRLPVRAG